MNWNCLPMGLLVVIVCLSACSSADDDDPLTDPIPQLSAAVPGTRQACESLATDFEFQNTTLALASVDLTAEDATEYCNVTGQMNERISAADGNAYAIGFEMRLPTNWNGRFLYQGNDGTDGSVAPAIGLIGSAKVNALQKGFAVISSDAGHPNQSTDFGIDPQARLDFGYQAVGTLTPMAKALINAAYGKEPDRSYIGGNANGGRHAMVAASRYADSYDGIVAVSPALNFPRASVAQLWGVKQWSMVAATQAIPMGPDSGLASALTGAERKLIASKILEVCDELDGLADGMVHDVFSCQGKFALSQVPVCSGERDGTCLSSAQHSIIADVFDGAETSDGEGFYSSWVYDPGIQQQDWADWKFAFALQRDALAYGNIFATPPDVPDPDTLAYTLNLDIDQAVAAIGATDAVYTESSLSFMTPPNPNKFDTLRSRGGKMIVIHGVSDGVFSMQDTVNWYDELNQAQARSANRFVRLFLVPGMGHARGGPATDQFDALDAVVKWVEEGEAPGEIIANVQPSNPEVTAQGWSATRSRPLCMFPTVAKYIKVPEGNEENDVESAESFVCGASN